MVRLVSFATKLLVVGGLGVSSIGFAGLAAAEPACGGGVPSASSHQPFSNGPATAASCVDSDDTSDTSMIDMPDAGSWPSHSAEFTYAPWTQVG
jgi:hypothetical protein